MHIHTVNSAVESKIDEIVGVYNFVEERNRFIAFLRRPLRHNDRCRWVRHRPLGAHVAEPWITHGE